MDFHEKNPVRFFVMHLIDCDYYSTLQSYFTENVMEPHALVKCIVPFGYDTTEVPYINVLWKICPDIFTQDVIRIFIEEHIFNREFDIDLAKSILHSCHNLDLIPWKEILSKTYHNDSKLRLDEKKNARERTNALIKSVLLKGSNLSEANIRSLSECVSDDPNLAAYSESKLIMNDVLRGERLLKQKIINAFERIDIDELCNMIEDEIDVKSYVMKDKVRQIAIRAAFNRVNAGIIKFLLALDLAKIIDLNIKSTYEAFLHSNVDSYEALLVHGFDIKSRIRDIIVRQSYPVPRSYTLNYIEDDEEARRISLPKSEALLNFILKYDIELPKLTGDLLYRLTQFEDNALLQHYIERVDLRTVDEVELKNFILQTQFKIKR